jgi:hypothetical protein
MWFTCFCPYCGVKLRLLLKLTDCKVMCPDCNKPFIAQSVDTEALVSPKGESMEYDGWPRGWLIVCQSCGHTELVHDDWQGQSHCSRCGSALPTPEAPSKRIRPREVP